LGHGCQQAGTTSEAKTIGKTLIPQISRPEQVASNHKQVTANHYLCWSAAIAYGHAIPDDP
jgi:hypothetical protein